MIIHPGCYKAMEHNTTTNLTHGSYNSKMQFNNHDAETRGDRVGGNHVERLNNYGESNHGKICCKNGNTNQREIERNNVWHPQNQAHNVKEWSTTKNEQNEEQFIWCMIPMPKRKRRTTNIEDDDSENENQDFACNVIGQSWGGGCFSLQLLIQERAPR